MSDRTGEPPIVVEHREHLWWLLAEAAQLEHGIICQYPMMGNFVPWRDAAWTLLHERVRLLSDRCTGLAAEHPATAEITAAASSARQLAEALRAHVPAGR